MVTHFYICIEFYALEVWYLLFHWQRQFSSEDDVPTCGNNFLHFQRNQNLTVISGTRMLTRVIL